MKLLVQTTAPHMYLDMTQHLQQVQAFRPSVVVNSPYIQNLIAATKVTIVCASLKDEATDEEFAKYVSESEGNIDLAVSSFVKTFNPVEEVEQTVTPKAAEKKG